MGIPQAFLHPVATVPLGELAIGKLPPRGDLHALQILLERQKVDVLILVLVALGEVEIARVVHEIGGTGDIQDVARPLFDLLEGKGGLAAARRADDDERWW